MKSLLLTLGSLALSAGVVMNAYYQKKQFYPSVVYITKSSPSMAMLCSDVKAVMGWIKSMSQYQVLYLQAFVVVILTGKVMRKIFFGQLRAAELEHLIERSWYAVTETCLAFTVFRDDFSPRFVALFTVLLFLKCFHWLAEDRVDYMERSPMISLLFHVRAISLLLLLAFLDGYFVNHAYHNTLIKGPSVQLVFGFEYAILFTAVVHVFVKYVLHTIDLNSENPWENKAVYLLYTELILAGIELGALLNSNLEGFFKVMLYLIFLVIMIKVHTFPLFVIRPMYLTVREFKKAFNDAIMSRRAIRNMNTLYPDATPEELASSDNVCIICREEMRVSCKKLPCNHIFHSSCLRSWFQRQQTCPTCRMDVFRVQQRPQPQTQPPPAPAGLQMPQGMFPMWPPNLMPPVHPQQPPAGQNVNVGQPPATTAPSAATIPPMGMPPIYPNGAGADVGAGLLNAAPFVMPPFYMPFGFPPPPPVIPQSFTGLSDQQLRDMEGEERANIEARVQCLLDIQTLLNAAMIQIQQYSSVAGAGANSQGQMHHFAFPTTTAQHEATRTSSTATPSAAQANNTTPLITAANAPVSNTQPADDFGNLESELEGAVGYTAPREELIPDWMDGQEVELEDHSELNEIRRRRLERLSCHDAKKSSESSE